VVAVKERYGFIARTVRRFGYARPKRAEKTVALRFLERVSGYSRQQIKRLRGYACVSIELFAPHLSRNAVEAALRGGEGDDPGL